MQMLLKSVLSIMIFKQKNKLLDLRVVDSGGSD